MIASEEETNGTEIRVINERLIIAAVRHQELAEAALLAEHRLRDLVDGLDAVICEVQTRTGQPLFLSLPAKTFLGHSQEYWQEQPDFLNEIIHPDDRRRAAALFQELVQKGQDFKFDFRALSPDIEYIWMRNIVSLVHDDSGNLRLFRCVIVDITTQHQAALALEKAYMQDHRITETLQRSVLFMPPEDSFPGMTVRTFYKAASDEAMVGGDFWDTFACDHGHVAFVLGDVMGHGLRAAMFTAELKYTLRGFVREHEHPSRILSQMNACLYESGRLFREGLNVEGDDAPVCLMIAIFDPATGEGSVSSAGMEPLLLVRTDGQMEVIKVFGLPLGIEPDEVYAEAAFHVKHGDFVLLTTDGITEARHGKTFLSYEGLMRLAKEGRTSATLEQFGQSILDGSRAFAGGEFQDDACVLLARRQ